MQESFDGDRLKRCYRQACAKLLAERTPAGHWEGELSTSALATATAVVALETVRRGREQTSPGAEAPDLGPLIDGGLAFLASTQNADGGWGDTLRNKSNISTTMLGHAAFFATATQQRYATVVERARQYIAKAGGIDAVNARYGIDRTFSAPILTHCAIAGISRFAEVPALPFELACFPNRFYRWLQLPVVSYALPALIAIGQVRHHFAPPASRWQRWVRSLAKGISLKKLSAIQPTSGGFLEAVPLTSFVMMSLAAMGAQEHPVVRRGVEFLRRLVRPDGSWPIDTNLATWVTTLCVNALGSDLPVESGSAIREWLLNQQYRAVHPYTGAAPGGWAWTDLPGGVPDADDTPGALLALRKLPADGASAYLAHQAARAGIGWLLALQNRDGGWPTFCRGWGKLPFDRSAPDLTAHVLRALRAWSADPGIVQRHGRRIDRALAKAREYLDRVQGPEGAWVPLWFGNEKAADETNRTYGTSRVLLACRDLGWWTQPAAQRALAWLLGAQNADGGWGGTAGLPSSVEETALATEALLADQGQLDSEPLGRALDWLCARIEQDTLEPAPIGFYFAKLWYFERLYPIIFSVAALGRAVQLLRNVELDRQIQAAGSKVNVQRRAVEKRSTSAGTDPSA